MIDFLGITYLLQTPTHNHLSHLTRLDRTGQQRIIQEGGLILPIDVCRRCGTYLLPTLETNYNPLYGLVCVTCKEELQEGHGPCLNDEEDEGEDIP